MSDGPKAEYEALIALKFGEKEVELVGQVSDAMLNVGLPEHARNAYRNLNLGSLATAINSLEASLNVELGLMATITEYLRGVPLLSDIVGFLLDSDIYLTDFRYHSGECLRLGILIEYPVKLESLNITLERYGFVMDYPLTAEEE